MDHSDPNDADEVSSARPRENDAAGRPVSSAEIVDDVRILAAQLRVGDGMPLLERFRRLHTMVWRDGRKQR